MYYIQGFLNNMLPFMLLSFIFIVLFRFLSYAYMKKKNIKTTVPHEIGMVVFCLCTAVLISQAILPAEALRFPYQGKFNFILFKVIYDSIQKGTLYGDWYFLKINIIGNIAIFMPLGFFPPLLFHNINLKKTLLIGLLSSLTIEICQIPQLRITDIDDLWLNTLGAFAGYLVYLILKRILKNHADRFKVQKSEI